MIQLTFTVGFIALFLYEENTKTFVQEHKELVWVSMILTFAILFAMICFEDVRKKVPGNYICLFLFTTAESFMLGIIASAYKKEEVLYAGAICVVVFFALTAFAFQTKIDFTLYSGFLFVAMIVLIIFGFVTIFLPHNRILNLVYASIGALIFSLYIIFDTQMMLGGKHKYAISPEEYIFAVLNLYLDIINLFLMILQIIANATSE
ncbi:protein lifeguard 1-like [Centruroides vittatus]|uniref:protein lifeguard 1-like n=1 Tax=Centruroides vittatus TaxID=120091 RepID=UPI00351062F7